MTDEQIMQGLKWCYQVEGSCGDCPYRPDDIKKAKCHDRLGNDVIDLIKRQKEEIERLKTEKDNLIKTYAECQVENIKEFAEMLKEIASSSVAVNNGQEIYETKCYNIMAYKLDNLVKKWGAVNDNT